MAEITITKENFDAEVMNESKPVLLDFWATWCGPCRMLSPIIAEIAEEYEDTIKVGKINVDEQPELADAFHVSSIPLVVLMEKGEVKKASVGYKPKAEIEEMLK